MRHRVVGSIPLEEGLSIYGQIARIPRARGPWRTLFQSRINRQLMSRAGHRVQQSIRRQQMDQLRLEARTQVPRKEALSVSSTFRTDSSAFVRTLASQ